MQPTHEGESRILVREAAQRDIPAIVQCLREAFHPYRDSYTPGAFADTVLSCHALELRMKTMCVLVAAKPGSPASEACWDGKQSGQIAGTIAYQAVDEEEGHIRGMAVAPAAQGSGVAPLLLSSVESKLRGLHRSRITLDTTEPLVQAMRFYERHGFRRSGKVTDFFGMPLHEYVKVLRQATSPQL